MKLESKEEEGSGDDPFTNLEWLFDCICGKRGKREDTPKFLLSQLFFSLSLSSKVCSLDETSKHPTGEQFACGKCHIWSHLHCYVEYKELSDGKMK